MHSTASPLVERLAGLSISTQVRDAAPPDWRRPACSDACARRRVLVVEDGRRAWADVVSHDHADYERRLESVILAQARLLATSLAVDLGTVIRTGPLVVDLLADTATISGEPVRLAPLEWDLLVILARRLGCVVRYADLASWLWPTVRRSVGKSSRHPTRQALRANMIRLRRALGPAGILVETVANEGYRLVCLPVTEGE